MWNARWGGTKKHQKKKKKERERNDYRVSSERWFGRPLSFLNNHLLYSSAGNRAQPKPPNKTNFKEDLLSWFCFFESFSSSHVQKEHDFSIIWHCCSSSLPSLSVMLYLVPVSLKPLLLKSAMCSDWSAGASVLWLVKRFERVWEMSRPLL